MNWLYENECDQSIVNNKKYNAFNACLELNHKKTLSKCLIGCLIIISQ
jgi:hypothetical protein